MHANSIKLRTTGTSTPACPESTPTAVAAAGAGGVGQTQLQQLRPPTRRKKTRPRKPRCLKVTMENFSTFCQQTSLHGWQYIAQKQTSNMKHVFWAIIVSLSMGTAALFLYNNTMDYLHATVSPYQTIAILFPFNLMQFYSDFFWFLLLTEASFLICHKCQ